MRNSIGRVDLVGEESVSVVDSAVLKKRRVETGFRDGVEVADERGA